MKVRSPVHPASINIMYFPALTLMLVFIFHPFVRGLGMSLTDWNGYSEKFRWVGFHQYLKMASDQNVLGSIRNTLVYGFGSTFLQTFFGLLLALFLDKPGRREAAVKTIVYLPVIVSPLIMGYIWHLFFRFSGGAVNDVLGWLGIGGTDWFAVGSRSVVIITLINAYQFVGVAMVMFLAGLQGIPPAYQEAAAIDGASTLQRFRYITLPLLSPAFSSCVIFNIIGGMKLFDVIVATTDGGPGYASQSLSTMMYSLYFSKQEAGYAAALGNLMFVLIVAFSIMLLEYFKRTRVEA